MNSLTIQLDFEIKGHIYHNIKDSLPRGITFENKKPRYTSCLS